MYTLEDLIVVVALACTADIRNLMKLIAEQNAIIHQYQRTDRGTADTSAGTPLHASTAPLHASIAPTQKSTRCT